MKTSNKLLLTFFLALIGSSFISMVIARQNMVITKQNTIVGNKNVVKKEVLPMLNSDTLVMRDHYEYFLDPKTDAISIEAEENLISTLTIENEGTFDVHYGNYQNIQSHSNARIYIGIKSRENLVIVAEDNVQVQSTSGIIKVNSLSIESGDNSVIDLNIETNELYLDIDDHARIGLTGTVSSTELELQENALINLEKLTTDSLWLRMTDHASVNLQRANHITGKLKDNSSLNITEPYITSKARITDHASLNVEK